MLSPFDNSTACNAWALSRHINGHATTLILLLAEPCAPSWSDNPPHVAPHHPAVTRQGNRISSDSRSQKRTIDTTWVLPLPADDDVQLPVTLHTATLSEMTSKNMDSTRRNTQCLERCSRAAGSNTGRPGMQLCHWRTLTVQCT